MTSSRLVVEYLGQWKNSSPIVVVEGLQLQVDSMCDISLDGFGFHTHCTTPIDLNIARQTGDRSGPYIAGISVVIVAALVFALVVIVVAFLLIRRIKRLRQLRLILIIRYPNILFSCMYNFNIFLFIFIDQLE